MLRALGRGSAAAVLQRAFLVALWAVTGVSALLPSSLAQPLVAGYLAAAVASVGLCQVNRRVSFLNIFIASFVGTLSVAYFRASMAIPDIVGLRWAVLATCTYALIYLYARQLARRMDGITAVSALLWGLVLLHVLNLVLWWFGISNPAVIAQYLKPLDSRLNPGSVREVLPLSGGLAASAMVSALGGLSALLLLRWRSSDRHLVSKLFLIVAYGLAIVGIAVVGNRLAAGLLVVLSLTAVIDRIVSVRRCLVPLAGLLYLFPILYVPVFAAVSTDLEIAPSINAATYEAVTLSNRVFIWAEVLSYFSAESLESWIGHGSYGQLTSGMSSGYARYFESNWVSADMTSPHSAALQMFADAGVTGMVFLLIVIVGSARRISSGVPATIRMPLQLILLALSAFSAIEAELVLDGPIGYIFVFVVSYVAAINNDICGNPMSVASRRFAYSTAAQAPSRAVSL